MYTYRLYSNKTAPALSKPRRGRFYLRTKITNFDPKVIYRIPGPGTRRLADQYSSKEGSKRKQVFPFRKTVETDHLLSVKYHFREMMWTLLKFIVTSLAKTIVQTEKNTGIRKVSVLISTLKFPRTVFFSPKLCDFFWSKLPFFAENRGALSLEEAVLLE